MRPYLDLAASRLGGVLLLVLLHRRLHRQVFLLLGLQHQQLLPLPLPDLVRDHLLQTGFAHEEQMS